MLLFLGLEALRLFYGEGGGLAGPGARCVDLTLGPQAGRGTCASAPWPPARRSCCCSPARRWPPTCCCCRPSCCGWRRFWLRSCCSSTGWSSCWDWCRSWPSPGGPTSDGTAPLGDACFSLLLCAGPTATEAEPGSPSVTEGREDESSRDGNAAHGPKRGKSEEHKQQQKTQHFCLQTNLDFRFLVIKYFYIHFC